MTWCRNMNNEWINKDKEKVWRKKRLDEFVTNYDYSIHDLMRVVERIKELEEKAKRIYLEHTDWDYVLDMLDDDERKEYDEYIKVYDESYMPEKEVEKMLNEIDEEYRQIMEERK